MKLKNDVNITKMQEYSVREYLTLEKHLRLQYFDLLVNKTSSKNKYHATTIHYLSFRKTFHKKPQVTLVLKSTVKNNPK